MPSVIDVVRLHSDWQVPWPMLAGVIVAFLACISSSAALRLAPMAHGVQSDSVMSRREALCAAALLPLFASATAANADTASLAAAATPEGEAAFQAIYEKALAKKEATYKSMDLEIDDADRKELENMLRTKYCGFPAEIKCQPVSAKLKPKK